MNTLSDYPAYLITAIDNESAETFASANGLEEGSWFRLPSTLNDDPEIFKRTDTPILSKAEIAQLSKEDYDAMTLTGNSDVRILFAKDFGAAARHASKRNWWLHAWKFVADSNLDEVIEYEFYSC